MKLLAWNYQGLGRPSADRALRDIMKTMVGIFLMETTIGCAFVSRVLKKVGFSFFIFVPPLDRRGGLAFCWRLDFRFKLLRQSQNFFHLEVEPGGDDPVFLCTLLYGPTIWKEKSGFLNDLQHLNMDEHRPWYCMGDFNDILCSAEKQGG